MAHAWGVIVRPRLAGALEKALQRSPVVAILGPRQCGKTTLARSFAKDRQAMFYDLESEADLAQRCLALELHPDLPGKGHTKARHQASRSNLTSILDDAGTLPRTDLERF